VCSHCKQEKDESCFSKNRTNKDGLQSWCKQCRSDRQRAKTNTKRLAEAKPGKITNYVESKNRVYVYDDLTGRRFGRWEVIRQAEDGGDHNKRWWCKCDCGTERIVWASGLLGGKSKSCGCSMLVHHVGEAFNQFVIIDGPFRTEEGHRAWLCQCDCGNTKLIPSNRIGVTVSCGCTTNLNRSKNHLIHGLTVNGTVDPKYSMWSGAKTRAKKLRVPFNLDLDDIEIPQECPLLGIKLERGERCQQPFSPSLDRIIPELGYVKGNVMVISYRANAIKNDASVEELQRLTDNLTKILRERNNETSGPLQVT
jgi:hypothetical protein